MDDNTFKAKLEKNISLIVVTPQPILAIIWYFGVLTASMSGSDALFYNLAFLVHIIVIVVLFCLNMSTIKKIRKMGKKLGEKGHGLWLVFMVPVVFYLFMALIYFAKAK